MSSTTQESPQDAAKRILRRTVAAERARAIREMNQARWRFDRNPSEENLMAVREANLEVLRYEHMMCAVEMRYDAAEAEVTFRGLTVEEAVARIMNTEAMRDHVGYMYPNEEDSLLDAITRELRGV